MMISTRGRYALRVLVDMAEHEAMLEDEQYMAMKDVADRQELSLKYLEKILPMLVKAKIIEGVHGKGGGYRFVKKPSEISVGDILRLTEGDLVPVACLAKDAPKCNRVAECRTIDMCGKLNDMVNGYLDSVTIADLMKK